MNTNINRIILTMICIVVIICAVLTGIIIMKSDNHKNSSEILEQEIAEEEIFDDCTDEYEEIEEKNILKVNSEQEKVSPNCSFIEKVYYKKCNHTISKYLELPIELINLTKSEVQDKYSDWVIEKFANNEIIMYKEVNSECDEHYLVKDKDGKVIVYKILEDGKEQETESIDISTEYLTETDKINMKNGIRVNGKKNLNQLIEDFE